MTKNTLTDLTDHLFRAMERLSDGGLAGEDLLVEIKRANAVSTVGNGIVNAQRLRLDAYRAASDLDRPEVIVAVEGERERPEPERLAPGKTDD
ncbi:MAG: hypothetical protein LBQ79_07750 [Deltaproteobacteria bacterium]|jgi:hypothetical protein|nr:hypothetical protein [Deltaproteobacteria bacterium]